MPTVPRYDEQAQIQTQSNFRVSTDAPAAAFGAGSGKPMEAAGDLLGGLSTIAAKEYEKANLLRVMEADSSDTKYRNDLLWNKENGAMTRKGKNALGVSDEYSTAFDKHSQEVEKNLANDSQRTLYRQRAMKQKDDLISTLDRHEFQESQSYAKSIFKSQIETSTMDAENNWATPGKVESSLRDQEMAITAAGDAEGLPQEAIAAEIANRKSKTHRSIITRMVSGQNGDLAKVYYEQNKDQVTDSEDRAAIDKMVMSSSILGQSQREADRIIAASRGNEAKAYAAARDLEPELRKETEFQLDTQFRRIDSAKRAGAKSTFDSAWASAGKGQMPPANVWDALALNEQNSVREKIRQVVSGEPVIPNNDLFYEMRLAAALPETRNKFANEPLLPYKTKFSEQQWNELFDAQKALLKGDSTVADGIRTNSEIVNGTMLSNGIDPTPNPGSDDAKRVNELKRMVDEEVYKYERETKKKVTNQQLQVFVDDVLAKRVTEKGFFYDTEQSPADIVDVSDVPKDDQRKIREALGAAGRPVTPAEIIRAYRKKLFRIPSVGTEAVKPARATGGVVAQKLEESD